MEHKNSYFYPEFLLTLLLLCIIDSIAPAQWPFFRVEVFLGLVASFCAGYFVGTSNKRLLEASAAIGLIIAGVWTLYSILHSTFYYKDVILICIQGLLAAEIFLGLNAANPLRLSFIQALSLPLFLCCLVFIRNIETATLLSIIGYLICFIAVLKLKFYTMFSAGNKSMPLTYGVLLPPAVFFSIIIIIALVLFNRFPLSSLQKSGAFYEVGGGQETGFQQEYYTAQDEMVKKSSSLAAQLSEKEGRHKGIMLLSGLIKDHSSASRLGQEEAELISLLRNQGRGIDPAEAEEAANSTVKYIDKKTILKLKDIKDSIYDELKDYSLDFVNRLSILRLADIVQHSSSYQEIARSEAEIRAKVSGSSFDERIKRKVKDYAKQLKEWKIFEISREKMKDIGETDNALPDKLKQEISELKINSDTMQKTMSLREELNKLELSKDKKLEIEDAINEIDSAIDYSGLAKSIERLRGLLQIKDLKEFAGLGDLIATKARALIQDAQGQANDLLNEGVLDAARKEEIVRQLREMGSSESLLSDLEGYQKVGLISTELRNKLSEKISELKNLASLQLQVVGASEESGFGSENSQIQDQEVDVGTRIEKELSIGKRLVSVELTPDYVRMPLGEESRLTAKGTYSDTTSKDITDLAQWVSSDGKVSTVSKGKISALAMGETKITANYSAINSNPVFVVVEEPKLTSIIISPQELTVAMGKRGNLKAEGCFSDSSRNDITTLASWKTARPGVVKIDKGSVGPKMFGESSVTAAYLGMVSLPGKIKVIITLGWLIEKFIAIIIFLSLLASLLFLVLYFMTLSEKHKIIALYKQPREFIIKLYGNVKDILAIFDKPYKENAAPLSYAEFIEKEYSIEDKIFLKFTERFEEAKYSSHVLNSQDCDLVLNDYNTLLKVPTGSCAKLKLFLRQCLALLRRKPIFIYLR